MAMSSKSTATLTSGITEHLAKKEFDRYYFVTFCIEQYKQYKGISGAEAAEMLFSSGIANYLNDNFEILHTQSCQWLMEEIDERLNQEKA